MVHWPVWYNFDIALTNCWCGCYNGSVTSGGLAGTSQSGYVPLLEYGSVTVTVTVIVVFWLLLLLL